MIPIEQFGEHDYERLSAVLDSESMPLSATSLAMLEG